MKIAVVGLGLIGGSLARTIRARTAHTLYGVDLDAAVLADAVASGVLDAPLTAENLPECDLVAVALFPSAAVQWLAEHAAALSPRCAVFDCAGVKAAVCGAAFALAGQYGFSFFGGHPMAGTERSGWAASRDGLFDRASMLLVPPPETAVPAARCAADWAMLQAFFLSLGFGRVVRTTVQEHDRTIAYTSQLAHVVSSAYIKSPTAQNYVGFSAGSFKDMTRVAFLNETMWTELFLDNREPLGEEIDYLIDRLNEYRRALADGDAETLRRLLGEGRQLKLLSEQRGQAAAPESCG